MYSDGILNSTRSGIWTIAVFPVICHPILVSEVYKPYVIHIGIWHKRKPVHTLSAGRNFTNLSSFYAYDFDKPTPQDCLIVAVKLTEIKEELLFIIKTRSVYRYINKFLSFINVT